MNALKDLLRNATPSPWRHEASEKFSGDDWLIASMGSGHDDLNHYVCTDHIRCSEMVSGGAGEDADLIVALRNQAPGLIARLEHAERVLSAVRESGNRTKAVDDALTEYEARWCPQLALRF